MQDGDRHRSGARIGQIEVGTEEIGSRPALRNTEAYTLYLQGEHAADSFDQEGLEQAAGATFSERSNSIPPSPRQKMSSLTLTWPLACMDSYQRPWRAKRLALADEAAVKLDSNLAIACICGTRRAPSRV